MIERNDLATAASLPSSGNVLFFPFGCFSPVPTRPWRQLSALGAIWPLARRDGRMPVAAGTPGRLGTAAHHAAATDPLFQTAADRSNFLQQNVAELNLRSQYGRCRAAGR